MNKQILNFYCIAALLFALPACGGDSKGNATGPRECVVDEAALEDGRRCLDDDHCACGSHCSLGLCVATCTSDSDCDKGFDCDGFGRCRDSSETSIVALQEPTGLGHAEIVESVILQGGRDDDRRMTIVATDGEVQTIRVVAGEGALVALDNGDSTADADPDFQQEFTADVNLAEGEHAVVMLRREATGLDNPGSIECKVYDNSGNMDAIVMVSRPTTFLAAGPPPSIHGVYQGGAALGLLGVNGPRGEESAAPTRAQSTNIRMEIYEAANGRSTIVIEDPLHLLHPQGRWVGELVLDDEPHFEMPAIEVLAESDVAGSTVHIIGIPGEGVVLESPLDETWNGSLQVVLPLNLHGATSSVGGLKQTWILNLSRAEDLPANAVAPALDTPAALTYVADERAEALFGWEASWLQSLLPAQDSISCGLFFCTEFSDRRFAWSRNRGDLNFAPAGACVDMNDAKFAQRDRLQVVESFATEAWAGPFSTQYSSDLFSQGIGMASAANSNNSWADFLGRTGSYAALNGPLLASLVQNLRVISGPTSGAFLFAGSYLGKSAVTDNATMLHSFPTASGELLENVVPCALDFSETVDPPAASVTIDGQAVIIDVDAPAAGVDVCESLADSMECLIVDLESQVDIADRTTAIGFSGFGDTIFNFAFGDALITRGCIVPSMPSVCAETIACDDSGEFALSRLGEEQDATSGDLLCQQGSRAFRREVDGVTGSAEEILGNCRADLAALNQAALMPSAAVSVRDRLNSVNWSTPASCIDAKRSLAILGIAGQQARELVTHTNLRHGDSADSSDTIFARKLQHILSVYAFVASESNQVAQLPSEAQGAPLVAMEASLNESLDGWHLLLHPRVGSALLGLSKRSLHTPDYRERIIGEASLLGAKNRQSDGLVVTLQQTLSAQFELAETIATFAARNGRTQLPGSVIRALRLASMVEGWISALTIRGQAYGVTPPLWLESLKSSRMQFDAAWANIQIAYYTIETGANPLGITDADLPLYFDQVATDAGSRYTAITDYLLGNGANDGAIAQAIVDSAVDAFATARSGHIMEQQRLINVANSDAQLGNRINNATQDVGQTLQDLCGREAFGPLSDEEIVESLADDFSVRNCWFEKDRVDCQNVVPPQFLNADGELDAGAAESQMRNAQCMAAATRSFEIERECREVTHVPAGLEVTETVCARLARILHISQAPILREMQMAALENWEGFDISRKTITSELSAEFKLATIDSTYNYCVNPELPTLLFKAGDSLKRGLFLPVLEFEEESGRSFLRCTPVEGLSGTDIVREVSADSFNDLNFTSSGVDLLPDLAIGDACENSYHTRPPDVRVGHATILPASCYRGSLGSEAIALKSLAAEVEIARSQQQDHVEAYDIAMESCFILQDGNGQLASAQSSYLEERKALVEWRAAMEIGSHVANNTADCLDTFAGADSKALAGGSCAARAVEAGFSIAQTVIEANIEDLDSKHENTMALIEAATEEKRCFKEAELELVAADTAALVSLRAMQDIQIGYAEFSESLEQAELAFERGMADVGDAEESGLRIVERDPWFNGSIKHYLGQLELARRATYLALRAVEYEFQVSLIVRNDIFKAETAVQLDGILAELRQISSTNSINGAQPAELTEVVSLREHLLQLEDRSEAPDGEQVLTEIERFRLALQDSSYEVYEEGVFVGRAIPFQISPLSVYGRGQTSGVPIVSDNSCGERLWALNVSIQGDANNTFTGIAPQVNLQVRKRNSAYSTLCSPEAGGETFQHVSVRPRRNLFVGAGAGSNIDSGDPNEVFSIARIQALLDVAPAEFLTDAYTDGASTELAARPLFGDYQLFIPATSLVEVGSDGQPASDGLILNQVDDILLRVDYLSVAR